MGDINYTQTLQISVAKNVPVGTSFEKDFEILPAEYYTNALMNEDSGGRYMVAPSATVDPGIGTVATGKCFIITPLHDIEVQFLTTGGTSPFIRFLAGPTSVMHAEFLGVMLRNPSPSVNAKGRFFIVGD